MLGIQQFITVPLFQNNSLRVQNREALVNILAEAIARFTLEEVFADLKKSGVPVARIRNMAQVMEDPGAQAMVLEEVMADGVISRRIRGNAFRINAL